jgi:hypothetical protein
MDDVWIGHLPRCSCGGTLPATQKYDGGQAEVRGRFLGGVHAFGARLAVESWLALIISRLRIPCTALANFSGANHERAHDP